MLENLEKAEKCKKLKSPETVHPGAFKNIEIFITDSFTSLMFVLIRGWSLSALLSLSSAWEVTVLKRSDINLGIPLLPLFSYVTLAPLSLIFGYKSYEIWMMGYFLYFFVYLKYIWGKKF